MIILRGDDETIYIHSAGSNPQELPRPEEGPADGGEVSTRLAAKPILEQAGSLCPLQGRTEDPAEMQRSGT